MPYSLRFTTLDTTDNTPNSLNNQALTKELPLIGPSGENTALTIGGFAITAVSGVPADVCLQPGKTGDSWLDCECGGYAYLEGASEIYAVNPRGAVARVVTQAKLQLFDGESYISIPAGLWRIIPPE